MPLSRQSKREIRNYSDFVTYAVCGMLYGMPHTVIILKLFLRRKYYHATFKTGMACP